MYMNSRKDRNEKKPIEMSQYQIVYLTNMVQKDIKLAEKKGHQVSESITKLYETLLENC